ncbi:MAG: tol-pal system protein YbgF [Betaproteobacteria bacterium HGW-Betaproteobacteria-8]|nr:MAG: tol-pal system protein YbgF [Betaproteobacteria bacterium HGW-Betaproteobacteria-8]
MRWLVLSSIFLLALSQNANAFFEDKEARKTITDNQAQNELSINELKKNLQSLDQRVAEIEAIVKGRGLLDLHEKIEQLNLEVSRLKGELEVATHNIASTQQRQRDLYTDTDSRLRQLESPAGQAPAAGEGATSQAQDTSAEAVDFDAAMALAKASKHREAFDAFNKFLQAYPGSSRTPDAQYALGYAQFSLKNYKAAIATQEKLVQQFPDHAKAPDALYNIANAQIQLSDVEAAKKTLRILLSQYPKSTVAPSAQQRLKVLETIKVR